MALGFVFVGGFGGVAGALGEDDVVAVDGFGFQLLRVGFRLLVTGDGLGGWEGCDEGGVGAFEIPEVVEVAV